MPAMTQMRENGGGANRVGRVITAPGDSHLNGTLSGGGAAFPGPGAMEAKH